MTRSPGRRLPRRRGSLPSRSALACTGRRRRASSAPPAARRPRCSSGRGGGVVGEITRVDSEGLWAGRGGIDRRAGVDRAGAERDPGSTLVVRARIGGGDRLTYGVRGTVGGRSQRHRGGVLSTFTVKLAVPTFPASSVQLAVSVIVPSPLEVLWVVQLLGSIVERGSVQFQSTVTRCCSSRWLRRRLRHRARCRGDVVVERDRDRAVAAMHAVGQRRAGHARVEWLDPPPPPPPLPVAPWVGNPRAPAPTTAENRHHHRRRQAGRPADRRPRRRCRFAVGARDPVGHGSLRARPASSGTTAPAGHLSTGAASPASYSSVSPPPGEPLFRPGC